MNSSISTTCQRDIDLGGGKTGRIFSLPALEAAGAGRISRLPISLRIVLESLLRNCNGSTVLEEQVHELARWRPNGERTSAYAPARYAGGTQLRAQRGGILPYVLAGLAA